MRELDLINTCVLFMKFQKNARNQKSAKKEQKSTEKNSGADREEEVPIVMPRKKAKVEVCTPLVSNQMHLNIISLSIIYFCQITFFKGLCALVWNLFHSAYEFWFKSNAIWNLLQWGRGAVSLLWCFPVHSLGTLPPQWKLIDRPLCLYRKRLLSVLCKLFSSFWSP